MFKAVVPNPGDVGVIKIKGVPFGNANQRDVHGQFFSQNTNFLSHILPLPPLFHFHGAKSGSLADQIGQTTAREQRSDGVWYKARLYIDSNIDAVRQKAVQLWEAAKAGRLFASSGAVEATIKISDSGEILQWLVGELSLIDTRNNRENPASFHATVSPIKANLLDEIETGDVTVEDLEIMAVNTSEGTTITDDLGVIKSLLQDLTEHNDTTEMRSTDMSDENQDLLTQMQAQMAQMQQQMTELSTQNTTLQADIQARDSQIAELQGIVSTKSAEVAMGTHLGMVETWIKDGKITPAEKDAVLEVLSYAYQADTTTKGDVGFVNAIKGWMEVRPVNPVLGGPSQVYTNLNGSGVTEGPGGGTDPANIARLRRYAEIPDA